VSGFDRLVASYLSGLDLHAAYVAEIAAERAVTVGASADPAQQRRVLARRIGADVSLPAVFWCSNARHSAVLIDVAREGLNRTPAPRAGWFRVSARQAADLVGSAAHAMGLPIATPETLRANAETAVRIVSTLFDQLKTNGGLKAINRQYREERLRTEAAGGRAPAYPGWLFNYRQRVCTFVAEASLQADRLGFGRISAELVRQTIAAR
jgi:hypothetical protein